MDLLWDSQISERASALLQSLLDYVGDVVLQVGLQILLIYDKEHEEACISGKWQLFRDKF